jgi:hypothetical protein
MVIPPVDQQGHGTLAEIRNMFNAYAAHHQLDTEDLDADEEGRVVHALQTFLHDRLEMVYEVQSSEEDEYHDSDDEEDEEYVDAESAWGDVLADDSSEDPPPDNTAHPPADMSEDGCTHSDDVE